MLEEINGRQTISEKVDCQKGHNPDQKLRSQIVSKCKRGAIWNPPTRGGWAIHPKVDLDNEKVGLEPAILDRLRNSSLNKLVGP